jgi:hypothetical protein
MPLTFLRHFCIGSQLRWMISSFTWPDNEYFRRLAEDYHHTFGNLVYAIPNFNKLLAPVPQPCAYESSKTKRLSDDVYNLLLAKINSYAPKRFASVLDLSVGSCNLPKLHTNAQHLRKVEYNSVTFGVRGRTTRNSFVLLKKIGEQGQATLAAGQIVDIFRHARHDGNLMQTEDFFVVETFKPLEERHVSCDPYRKFPDLETQLYYYKAETQQDGSPCLCILQVREIISHFAAFTYVPPGIDEECILVLSLDRVRLAVQYSCR